MKKIALIEDDSNLQQLLRYNLEREGFRVVGSETGKGAISFLMHNRPDLLVLDIMLPDADGLEICQAVRRHPDLWNMPIIFLSARGAETDRIVGLELGANDYVVKPFFVRELLARIKLQMRQQQSFDAVLASGELELDRTRFEVRLGGQRIGLTATEFRLLEFLMSRPSRVFSRSELLDHVWGTERNVAERAVDVCVLRLRQKLSENPQQPKWIHSVRGFGYTFDPERVGD